MTARIGWYVHHHGAGHLTRMRAVRPHVRAEVTVFSSLPAPAVLPPATDWVVLPRDDEPESRGGVLRDPHDADADPTAGGRLHWAPLRHAGHRSRLAAIAAAAGDLDAFVVDVSAEVAAFVRLLGLPLALFTQPGERVDAAHRLAFDLADVVICPWPAGMHPVDHLGDPARVHEVGGISRHAGRPVDAAVPGSVLLLGGIGAEHERDATWRMLHAELPDERWSSAGFLPGSEVDDPWPLLGRAEVVVSAAGQNSVADIAAASRAAVLVPSERPFDEQAATARALARTGGAVVLDSLADPAAVAAALALARSRPSAWASWGVDAGALAAARLIEERIA
jgi:hypothetical protein